MHKQTFSELREQEKRIRSIDNDMESAYSSWLISEGFHKTASRNWRKTGVITRKEIVGKDGDVFVRIDRESARREAGEIGVRSYIERYSGNPLKSNVIAMVNLMSKDEHIKYAIIKFYEQMMKEFEEKESPPILVLVTEWLVLTWIDVQYRYSCFLNAERDGNSFMAEYYDLAISRTTRRLDRSMRRYCAIAKKKDDVVTDRLSVFRLRFGEN
jgi:hypothetical protein